jgi:hypothetical protein
MYMRVLCTLRSNAPLFEGGLEACFQRATGYICVRINCCHSSPSICYLSLECPPPRPALPMRKVALSRAWKATGFAVILLCRVVLVAYSFFLRFGFSEALALIIPCEIGRMAACHAAGAPPTFVPVALFLLLT